MERLQKRIAECGICSRRHAEELITSGKVKVNGEIITILGTKVSYDDVIEINGKIIEKETKKYYVINKPRGVLCTSSDDRGRKTIIDILPEQLKKDRLYCVGRLDYDTKGVLLLTNDGEFMNTLVGPKSGIEKEYLARVKKIVTFTDVKKLSEGIIINGKKTLPAIVTIESLDYEHGSSLVKITITEGNYHQVKEMFKAIDHEVKKLTRIRFGHLTINNLKVGEVRVLNIHDVKTLYALAKMSKDITKHKEN